MRFDVLVLIGRFAPFHDGHLTLLQHALAHARRVVVFLGSAGRARDSSHPWSTAEREQMLRAALPEAGERLSIRPLRDHLYNENAWIAEVQAAVRDGLDDAGPNALTIGLARGRDDPATAYLTAFPQWPLVDIPLVDCLPARALREHFLEDSDAGMALVRANVPPAVAGLLEEFRARSPHYAGLVEERSFLETYRRGWASAPYPPTFVTVDGVVVHSGHVLLVQRRAQPGKGQWALPGGFVRGGERLLDAILRELREETRLKLPAPVLRGSLRAREVFDHPERSLRGRTITHAFLFEFPSGELPAVRGGSDASRARWLPFSELSAMESQMYEDHFHIVGHFLGTL